MKTIYFLGLTMALALASCTQKSKEATTDSHTSQKDTTITTNDTIMEHTTAPAETPAALYACPMHPEVQGEKDSECPKCGMKLTEPVTKK